MEFLILVILILVPILRIVLRKRETMAVEQRQGTLCRSCANSHLVKSFSGKELISCTFGGTLRPIKFEVRECTGFSNRLVTIAPLRVAGFVREESEVYAEIRIA
ncbi:MAG TPA: hypothetical protein VFC15_14800 [Candidatus Limnocylindrales bacterium]|jgi:hypothetical protein|nr:hypothetical protein [Candidatus Limnocylindrales bacterium]